VNNYSVAEPLFDEWGGTSVELPILRTSDGRGPFSEPRSLG